MTVCLALPGDLVLGVNARPRAPQAGPGVSLVPADGLGHLALSAGAALGQQPLHEQKKNLREIRTALDVVPMQNTEEVCSAPRGPVKGVITMLWNELDSTDTSKP